MYFMSFKQLFLSLTENWSQVQLARPKKKTNYQKYNKILNCISLYVYLLYLISEKNDIPFKITVNLCKNDKLIQREILSMQKMQIVKMVKIRKCVILWFRDIEYYSSDTCINKIQETLA